jgi:hypothetical protein
MTRLAKYQLYECIKCQSQYRHAIWASISVHAPLSANISLLRKCVDCGFVGPLDDWIFMKDLELLTPKEKDVKVHNLMFSLGLGPKPKHPSFIQRISMIFTKKNAVKIREYEAYKDIKIIGDK